MTSGGVEAYEYPVPIIDSFDWFVVFAVLLAIAVVAAWVVSKNGTR